MEEEREMRPALKSLFENAVKSRGLTGRVARQTVRRLKQEYRDQPNDQRPAYLEKLKA